jgi:hypothetical protein
VHITTSKLDMRLIIIRIMVALQIAWTLRTLSLHDFHKIRIKHEYE